MTDTSQLALERGTNLPQHNPPSPDPLPAPRLEYLDALRVAALIAVITVHLSGGFVTSYWKQSGLWWTCNLADSAARFAVPAFVMISGALLLSDPRSSDFFWFLRKRLKKIVLPLVAWNCIYQVILLVYDRVPITPSSLVVNLFTNRHGSAHLWFLYMLVFLYLAAPFLKVMIDHTDAPRQIAFVALCFLINSVYPIVQRLTPLQTTVYDSIFTDYAGYYVLGYVLHRHFRPSGLKSAGLGAGLYLVGFAVTALGMYGVFKKNGSYDGVFYSYLSLNVAVMASGAFILFKSCSFWFRLRFLAPVLKFISTASFGVYLVHMAVFMTYYKYGWLSRSSIPVLSLGWNVLSVFAVSLVLTVVIRQIKYLRSIAP